MHENQQIGRTVAIEPSRQFKKNQSHERLEIAKIEKLETDSAKNRQVVMESIQSMYGGSKNKNLPRKLN